MTQEIPNRFTIVYARTMIDLIMKMNQVNNVFCRVIYFGKNEGEYTTAEYGENITDALYIAVYEAAPMMVFPVEDVVAGDIEFTPDTTEMKITKSA